MIIFNKLEVKNVLYRALVDSWGFIIVFIFKFYFIKINNIFTINAFLKKSLLYNIKQSIKNIITVVNNDEYTLSDSLLVYTTIYGIILLVLFTIFSLAVILYAVNYMAYIWISFIISILIVFWEIQNISNLYIQFFTLNGFIFYAFYKIHKTFIQTNVGPKIILETADCFLQFGIRFYIRLLIHFLYLFFKSLYIRILNFNSNNITQQILFTILLLYYAYSECFIIQSFTAQNLSRRLYNDTPTFTYEFIAIFFTSSVAAIFKIIYLITNRLYWIIPILISNEQIKNNIFFNFLEDDRCHFLYIIFKKTPFLNGLFNFRDIFWKGDIKKHAKKITFKDDFAPILIIVFVLMKKVLVHYSIIGPFELGFIIGVNGISLIEIFNTYGLVKILVYAKSAQTYHNLIKLDYNEEEKIDTNAIIKIRNTSVKMNEFFDNAIFSKKKYNDTTDYVYFETQN